jgi:hypothetical protein
MKTSKWTGLHINQTNVFIFISTVRGAPSSPFIVLDFYLFLLHIYETMSMVHLDRWPLSAQESHWICQLGSTRHGYGSPCCTRLRAWPSCLLSLWLLRSCGLYRRRKVSCNVIILSSPSRNPPSRHVTTALFYYSGIKSCYPLKIVFLILT